MGGTNVSWIGQFASSEGMLPVGMGAECGAAAGRLKLRVIEPGHW